MEVTREFIQTVLNECNDSNPITDHFLCEMSLTFLSHWSGEDFDFRLKMRDLAKKLGFTVPNYSGSNSLILDGTERTYTEVRKTRFEFLKKALVHLK